MKKRTIGQSGIKASAVAFGAWAIGGGPWWGTTDDELSIRAIHTALDAGIDLIDTAPAYGFGRSEEVVGRALKGRRDRAIIATKSGTLDSVQPRYSMLDRKIEEDILPCCEKHNLATLVYSPLEQGLLTGKIGVDQVFEETAFRNKLAWYKPANRKRVLDLLTGWEDLTSTYSCTVAQLVIAWTIAQPGITFALCGARKPENVADNAGAGVLELDAADIARIRRDVESLGNPE